MLLASLLLGCSKQDEGVTPPAPQPSQPSAPRETAAPLPGNGSAPVKVQGSGVTPQINAVQLAPAGAVPGDLLQAECQVEDPDSTDIYVYYEWYVNGQLLPGEIQQTLKTDLLRKGDSVEVAATPDDYRNRGETKRSKPVVLRNSRPFITSAPPATMGGKFAYRVVATDKDNDVLAFSLEKAPAGMTIDAATGLIEGSLTSTADGEASVKVVVSDGEASTSQEFTLRLQKLP